MEKTITVNSLLLPEITGSDPFELTGGQPEGGIYSGDGVSNGKFNPLSAGVGTHAISYEYSSPEGCIGSAFVDITVNPKPEKPEIIDLDSLLEASFATA